MHELPPSIQKTTTQRFCTKPAHGADGDTAPKICSSAWGSQPPPHDSILPPQNAAAGSVPQRRWKPRDRTETRRDRRTSGLARSARAAAMLSAETTFQTQLLNNEVTTKAAPSLPKAAGSPAPSQPPALISSRGGQTAPPCRGR